ncbi:hypothetical protein HZB74_01875 [Candidatus Saccharibacteria bacterium]|nr:hypothetical protein [Candidatus Saccharibacteria bacterium]
MYSEAEFGLDVVDGSHETFPLAVTPDDLDSDSVSKSVRRAMYHPDLLTEEDRFVLSALEQEGMGGEL